MTQIPHRFAEETQNTTGSGPDFPGSAGDREKGKFRPSRWPRWDVVAVSGDDGRPVTASSDEMLAEILAYQKGLLLALSLLSESEPFSVEDILNAIQ